LHVNLSSPRAEFDPGRAVSAHIASDDTIFGLRPRQAFRHGMVWTIGPEFMD